MHLRSMQNVSVSNMSLNDLTILGYPFFPYCESIEYCVHSIIRYWHDAKFVTAQRLNN